MVVAEPSAFHGVVSLDFFSRSAVVREAPAAARPHTERPGFFQASTAIHALRLVLRTQSRSGICDYKKSVFIRV